MLYNDVKYVIAYLNILSILLTIEMDQIPCLPILAIHQSFIKTVLFFFV